MRRHELVRVAVPCGHCRSPQTVGATVVVLQGAGWRKVRCLSCEPGDVDGEAAEPVPVTTHKDELMASVRAIAAKYRRGWASGREAQVGGDE